MLQIKEINKGSIAPNPSSTAAKFLLPSNSKETAIKQFRLRKPVIKNII